jgi:hypothetical protein
MCKDRNTHVKGSNYSCERINYSCARTEVLMCKDRITQVASLLRSTLVICSPKRSYLERVNREKRDRKKTRRDGETEKGQTRTEKKSSPPPSTPGVWANHNGFSLCRCLYIVLYRHTTGSIYIAKCLCTSEQRFGATRSDTTSPC